MNVSAHKFRFSQVEVYYLGEMLVCAKCTNSIIKAKYSIFHKEGKAEIIIIIIYLTYNNIRKAENVG